MPDIEQQQDPENVPITNFAQLRQAFQNIGVSVFKRALAIGQTAYNTGTGWFLGIVDGVAKFSIGDGGIAKYLTWDGTNLVINGAIVTGYATTTKGTFGGDGSDGALNITSGTTTVNLGGASTVTLNYTSISITGTGVLAFSNPHPNGTIITLKSQGAVILTSSATPMIDASGMGGQGGTKGTGGINTVGTNGSIGNKGNGIFTSEATYGGLGIGGNNNTNAGGSAGLAFTSTGLYTNSLIALQRKMLIIACGSGGGGGGGGGGYGAGNIGGDGGDGGAGGGGLVIECAGALNFTTTNGISVAGKNGGNATIGGGTGTSCAGGGGGGGGTAGFCIILYNTLTANTGTIIVTNGSGGSGSASLGTNGTDRSGGSGGGGGGHIDNTGGVGATATIASAGANGGNANPSGAGGGASGGGLSPLSPYSGGTGGTAGTASTNITLTAQNKIFV